MFPTKTYLPSQIIEKGIEIPLDFVYDNPNWKRHAYKSYWHSTVSGDRWSYVPTRLHYAMHTLFTTYLTGSIYYDFIHDLGIAEESDPFTQNHNGVFDYIRTVAMQVQIHKILTYGNQVLIIASPQRNGLQVLNIPMAKIKPIYIQRSILCAIPPTLA